MMTSSTILRGITPRRCSETRLAFAPIALGVGKCGSSMVIELLLLASLFYEGMLDRLDRSAVVFLRHDRVAGWRIGGRSLRRMFLGSAELSGLLSAEAPIRKGSGISSYVTFQRKMMDSTGPVQSVTYPSRWLANCHILVDFPSLLHMGLRVSGA
ncbi:hypothetical protein F5J12DRAFT_287517 [Pisolithus orientalis]|uniref:uncharacterized protein n=1 Tax=Pisolithus orientalis TaxID=936130 RepID=UPI002225B68B|nr:uncharacterized protein F5J12DRAFT_287517 [Pisolithus orientalis]KAI5998983.1 hypothetical protein F5J12DRAFT_287517 [Pisolithus orientalis]